MEREKSERLVELLQRIVKRCDEATGVLCPGQPLVTPLMAGIRRLAEEGLRCLATK